MSINAPFLQPVPSYDDDAFIPTERVPRIVIECSKDASVTRVYEISSPSDAAARTVFDANLG